MRHPNHNDEDVASLTLHDRQDIANERAAIQHERLHDRRGELTGRMEWIGEDEE